VGSSQLKARLSFVWMAETGIRPFRRTEWRIVGQIEGEKMAPLCAEFGISRKTGYKIFDRRTRLKDSDGFRYIHYLLHRPNMPVEVMHLRQLGSRQHRPSDTRPLGTARLVSVRSRRNRMCLKAVSGRLGSLGECAGSGSRSEQVVEIGHRDLIASI